MEIHLWLEDWSRWLWPWVLLHLCEASLFFGLVALAVRVLRAAPARTRYFFWLAATVKLLFPSVFLGWLLWQNPLAEPVPSPPSLEEPVGASPASAWDRPIHRVLEPLLPSQILVNRPQPEGRQFPLYGALTLISLTGSLFLVVRWTRPNLRLARTVRAARTMGSSRETEILRRVRSWLALKREIQVLVSPRFAHAGLWGIRNPVILLPQGATVRLSDEELAAILIHELVHLERRDNLVVLLQRVLTSLLWFYPPTWLIDRKLLEERERSCDEEVLRLTQAPETYASGILKVVGACLEGRMAGASSIGGSSFKRRMADILGVEPPRKLGLRGRALAMAFGIGMAVFSAGFGLASLDIYVVKRTPQGSDSAGPETLQQVASKYANADAPLPGSKVRPLVEETIRSFPFRLPPSEVAFHQIARSQQSPIGFRNPRGSPLLITDARMSAIRFKQGGVHLLLPRVSFSSQSTKYIAAARLELRHRFFASSIFAEMYELGLKPQDSFSTDRLPGDNPQRFLHGGRAPLPPRNLLFKDPANRLFHPYVIYLPLEHRPADFTVEIRGVRFANGDTWGTLPERLPNPDPSTQLSRRAPGPDLIVSADPES